LVADRIAREFPSLVCIRIMFGRVRTAERRYKPSVRGLAGFQLLKEATDITGYRRPSMRPRHSAGLKLCDS